MVPRRFGAVAVLALTLSACTSQRNHQSHPTGSLTASNFVTVDLRNACAYMTQKRLLKRADDLLTDRTDTRELTDVILSMQNINGFGPPKIRLAIQNIVDGLTSIRDGTPNAAAVLPDTRLIASECRTQGLAVPETG